MNPQNQGVSLSLDSLKESSKTHTRHFSIGQNIPIQGSYIPLSISASDQLINTMFEQGKKILTIASGLAIAKGKLEVSSEEIIQATEIAERSLEDYLPVVGW